MKSLAVTKDAFVEDEDGVIVCKLIEGDAKKPRGHRVNEHGEIIDNHGNVQGCAEPYEPPEGEAPAEADLSIIEGKVINKSGKVVDPATGAALSIVALSRVTSAWPVLNGKVQIWSDDPKIVGRAEGSLYSFDNAQVGKDGVVVDGDRIIGRLIEGDAMCLLGREVDEDGDVLDKNGNTIGNAGQWEPEEKQHDVNPMSGCKVNKEGDMPDADGNSLAS